MKIYNEIVIDMNPESSTFEETLYEDSFEYEGDMYLAQEGTPLIGVLGWEDQGTTDYTSDYIYVDGKYYKKRTDQQGTNYYELPEGQLKAFVDAGFEFEGIELALDTDGDGVADENDAFPNDPDKKEKEEGTDWGAQNITKDMFVNPDGTQKSIQDVYATLDPILTGITGKDLENYINDILPKFTGVPAEEKGFLAKEKEFTERGLGLKKEADIYGLQPKLGEATTPTTGAGMRASIGTQADIKKGFGAAYGTYGLGMDEAAFTEEKGLYGLEKGVAGAYETDVVGTFDPLEHFADPGGTALTDPDYFGKEGGRVPSRSETFLDFLTQLPDAGGM